MMRSYFLVCITFVLLSSFKVHGALISFNDYTRDSESNVVTGGGLQWMKWDVTTGLSINQALETYEGWSLASNDQMNGLFSHWFGLTQSNELTRAVKYDANIIDDTTYVGFFNLFGISDNRSVGQTITSAFYGSDKDQNGIYNVASIRLTYAIGASSSSTKSGISQLFPADWYSTSDSVVTYGVALVRDIPVQNMESSVSVSEPSLIVLLGIGILALMIRRKKN
ncbi:PEP-CTERM sorting domain-containing protein [Alteromonas sp. ASW11-36]|uniref:PEP-CTERM sorting domain-containing protein n=1 Tax=Alteromonas arenosi TaxID=3055817 RepID=A0ABT7SZ59_9ALTE|nr:PEP-CTERM sorting domain-containing protein [Alteromonas sp. ASW11-36]MDM7861472.1 PEP-CTERM sorting domain-containing protein [Alteromonas sp. ASW11-36]